MIVDTVHFPYDDLEGLVCTRIVAIALSLVFFYGLSETNSINWNTRAGRRRRQPSEHSVL